MSDPSTLDTHTLLAHLSALDIRLKLEDGKLSADAPSGVLTPELKAQLKEIKPALVALLSTPDLWTLARLELAPTLERAAYPLYLACKWGAFLVMLKRFTAATADPILETRQALEQRPHLLHASQVHALEVLANEGEVLGRAEVPTLTLPPVCARCRHWTPGAQGVGECGQSWTLTTAGTLCDVPGARGQGTAFRPRAGATP